MDEQTEFSRMEKQLQLKIVEITHIKSMLLKEIDRMKDTRHSGQAVHTSCLKLQECVDTLKDVMLQLRREIARLPSILGEQTGCLLLKIREAISDQWHAHRSESDALKNELAARTSQNQFLQQRVAELERQLERFNAEVDEDCNTPMQHQISSITDDMGGRSPAIEYPAFKLDANADDSIMMLPDDQDIRSRLKIREHHPEEHNQSHSNILKTEPYSAEESKPYHFSERSISYRKIEHNVSRSRQQRTKNFISGFRHGVEVTNTVVGYENPFGGYEDGSTLHDIQEKLGTKATTPDIFLRKPSFSRIELTSSKKKGFQEKKELLTASSENIESKKPIWLGGSKKSASRIEIKQQLPPRNQSREKIQVTQKAKPAQLMAKDLNSQQRPMSKQKIQVTIKSQDLCNSKLNRSGISKFSSEDCLTGVRSVCTDYSWLQTQLDKIDIYLGDKRTEQRYEGQKKDFMRCGKGRLEYVNGLIYEGDFREGMRHGSGILSLNGKTIYEGEWQRDRVCGKGRISNIYLINKRKLEEESAVRYCLYDGYFQDNKFQGHGTLTLSNGDQFIGHFSQGMLQGQHTVCKQTSKAFRFPTGERDFSVV